MKEILNLQNDKCMDFAQQNIDCATVFKETLNLEIIGAQLSLIKELLLTQGIFIHDFIDTLEDTKQ